MFAFSSDRVTSFAMLSGAIEKLNSRAQSRRSKELVAKAVFL